MNNRHALSVAGFAVVLGLVFGACATTHVSFYQQVATAGSEQDALQLPGGDHLTRDQRVAWYHLMADYNPLRTRESLARATRENPAGTATVPSLLARVFAGLDVGDIDAIWQAASGLIAADPEGMHGMFAAAVIHRYVLFDISSTRWSDISQWCDTTLKQKNLRPGLRYLVQEIKYDLALRRDDPIAAMNIRDAQGRVNAFIIADPVGMYPHYNLRKSRLPMEAAKALQAQYVIDGKTVKLYAIDDAKHPIADKGDFYRTPGLVADATFFTLPSSGKVLITLEHGAECVVQVDGKNVLLHDTYADFDSGVSSALVSLGKGTHRILRKMALSSRDSRPNMFVTDDRGVPIATFASFETQPARLPDADDVDVLATVHPAQTLMEKPLRSYPRDPVRRAEAALIYSTLFDGNHRSRVLMQEAVAMAPRWAGGMALLRDAWMHDPALPESLAKRQARKVNERLMEVSGGVHFVALLHRFSEAMDNNQREEAAEVLETLRSVAPSSLRVLRASLLLYDNNRWAAERQQVLEKLAELDPLNPQSVQDLLAQRADEFRLAEARMLFERQLELSGDETMRLDMYDREGDTEKARALLRDVLTLYPGDVNLRYTDMVLLISGGRFDEASKDIDWFRALPGGPDIARQWEATVKAFQSDPAAFEAYLQSQIDKDPARLDLRRNLYVWQGKKEFAEDAADGLAVIADYQAREQPYQAAVVNVLDEYLVRFLPGGSRIERVHTIVHLLSQRAVEYYTEFKSPKGVTYQVRALQPDGTEIRPHAVRSKNTVAFPRLSVGDFVEQDYVTYTGPEAVIPEFTDTFFYFITPHTPTFRSHLKVFLPDQSPVKIAWEPTDNPLLKDHPPVTLQRDGYTEWDWRYDNLPGYTPEPRMPPATEILPLTHMYYPLSYGDIIAAAWEQNEGRSRPSEEIREFLASHRGTGSIGDQVRRLYRAVCATVEEDKGATQAAHVLLQKRGDRLSLMRALLNLMGVDNWQVYVQPSLLKTRNLDGERLNLLTHTLMAADPVGKGRAKDFVWMDGGSTFALADGYTPLLENGRGLLVTPPGSGDPKWVTVPRPQPPLEQRRKSAMRIVMDAKGNATAVGEEQIFGYESRFYREKLRANTPQKQHKIFQQAINSVFKGAVLRELQLQNLEDAEKPLIISYTFDVARVARRSPDGWELHKPFYAAMLGKRFISTLTRSYPMFINQPYLLDDSVTIVPPEGYRLTRGPIGSVDLNNVYGNFRFSLGQKPDGSIELTRQGYVPVQRIEPGNSYLEFMKFCGQADRLEEQPWVLSPVSVAGDAPQYNEAEVATP